jgi:hypothetical protein
VTVLTSAPESGGADFARSLISSPVAQAAAALVVAWAAWAAQ